MSVKNSEFNRSLKSYGKKLNGRFEQFLKKIAFLLHKKIVKRTPVDTGQARGGWNIDKSRSGWLVSNFVPYIKTLEFGGYGKKSPSDKTVGGKPPYTISRVSRKAPRGMVRISMDEIEKWIKRNK